MIESIFIQNFGIVEETSFTPQSGFNVITGETGAGKSMIVGAISLLLGNRSSGILIPDPNRKAVLEMTVLIDEITVNEVFNKYDIDFSNPLVIRREISPNGRSRSFINDSLVPLTALSELSSKIVDLSEQHENLSLNKADMRLQMIDDFAQNENFREEYLLKFNVYQQLKLKRNQIEKLLKNAKTDFDFVQFQLSELIELNYQMGEQSELEQELELLLHAEEIKNALFQAVQIIDSDSTGLLDRLNEVVNALRQASKHYQNSVEIVSRFENIRIDVKELLNDIERDFEKIEVDPQRLIVVENRLSSIYRLVAKHQLVKGDDLIFLREKFSGEVANLDVLEQELEKIDRELQIAFTEFKLAANNLSKSRQMVVQELTNSIWLKLSELAMPDAKFQINLCNLEVPTELGQDEVEFLFSANKGIIPQPLSKVASGGELSRLMLAIKSVIGLRKKLPTLIFDEIDTGISGETAQRVGVMMRHLAEAAQLIVISHLPQIAAKANSHYLVEKQIKGDTTMTLLRFLEHADRVQIIATMLSGDRSSESARQTALEMLGADI